MKTKCPSLASERGATLLIVMLVLALLGGIGLFAAQASITATRTSGVLRLGSLGRTAAETALSASMASLGKTPDVEIGFLVHSPPGACLGQSNAPAGTHCTRKGRAALEKELGLSFFTPYDPQSGAQGSLGRASADIDFLVETSDLHGLDRPIAGFDASRAGAASFSFMNVVVHAESRIRLAPEAAPKTTLTKTSLRAEFTVGPLAVP